MFKFSLLFFIVFISCFSHSAIRTWSGGISSDWFTGANWSSGIVPTSTDDVRIINRPFNPILTANVTVNEFRINSGSVDLMGHTININGNAQFYGGTILSGLVNINSLIGLFDGTIFTSNVNATCEDMTFYNSEFYGAVNNFTKTGSSDDICQGLNIFGGATSYSTLKIEGTGGIALGRGFGDEFYGVFEIINNSPSAIISIADGSDFNIVYGDLILDNGTSVPAGTQSIYVAKGLGPNGQIEIHGQIQIKNNGSAGVFFGENGGETYLLPTSSLSSPGFVDGTLQLANVTADVPILISPGIMSGSAILNIVGSVFNYGIIAESPRLFTSYSSFFDLVQLTKTGAGNDVSDGGNYFENASNATIINQGSGDLVLGNFDADHFNGNCTIINETSSKQIRIAENSVGNEINGTLTLDNGTLLPSGSRSIRVCQESAASLNVSGQINLNNNGSAGIFFGGNGGVTTVSNSATIGSLGFVDGTLELKNVICNLSTTLNMLSGTASLKLGPGTSFTQGLTAYSPRLFLNGSSFDGTVSLYKTGASNDLSIGGNIFNNLNFSVIENQGTGDLILGNVNPDIVNGSLTLNPSVNNDIHFAENSIGNIVNGILILDNVSNNGATTRSIHLATEAVSSLLINGGIKLNNNGSDGVFFGENGGVTTISNTANITSNGFVNGTMELKNVICNLSTTLNMLSGTASLKLGPGTTFNQNFNAISPRLFMNGIIGNAALNLTKNGSSADISEGGNTYNANINLFNSGNGDLNLAGTLTDIYNQNINVTTTGTGNIDISHTSDIGVYKNILFNTSSIAINGTNGGHVIFSGAIGQTISNAGSFVPTFNYLRMNKAGNDLTLLCPIKIGIEADFITGRIFTTSTNYLEFIDNADVEPTNISNNSFVNGPVKKVGNDFFVFPVGKGTRYQPAGIDAPLNVTDVFTGEYFDSNSDLLYTHTSKVASLNNISTCDYWTIDRTNGTSDVNVWLSWNTPGCNGITLMSDLVVSRWDSGLAQWQDHGNGGTSGTNNDGYLVTASAVTSFSPFALASLTPSNPLPVELLSFQANCENDKVIVSWSTASENNTSYFTIEKSRDGSNWYLLGEIAAAGYSTNHLFYSITDNNVVEELNYYRLIQYDIDGVSKEYPIINETCNNEFNDLIRVYPNPNDGNFSVEYENTLSLEKGIIVINDARGKKVYEIEVPIQPSKNIFHIENLNVTSGLYYIQFLQEKFGSETVKFNIK